MGVWECGSVGGRGFGGRAQVHHEVERPQQVEEDPEISGYSPEIHALGCSSSPSQAEAQI